MRLGGLLVVAGATRLAFMSRMDLPIYDPWRHLLLVDRLRGGTGFTLFDGQPYIWYQPPWHILCSWIPPAIGPGELAALLSLLAVPAFYLVLLKAEGRGAGRFVPTAGALLVALCGPLVTFTCHYGSEAFALLLTLVALRVVQTERWPSKGLAGLALGIALLARMSFAFNALLFVPYLRTRRGAGAFVAGLGLPLVAGWWRNHRAITEYPYLFTWDGLATPTVDFGPLSTLVVQMHPTLSVALRRLHEQIVPWPEWIRDASGIRIDLILFVLLGVAGVLLSRRRILIAVVGLTLGYFLLLDRSLSSNFFRIYLCVFPVLFWGIAVAAARLGRRGVVIASAPVAAVILAGAAMLNPPPAIPIEAVTPPERLLTDDRYLVNSGFYHPETLIYRFPERRFIGLPLEPEALSEFRRHFPDYEAILWHDFSVQDALKNALDAGLEGYRPVQRDRNAYDRVYTVFEAGGALGDSDSGE